MTKPSLNLQDTQSRRYDEYYRNKEKDRMDRQVFEVQDVEELSDFKSLAEFYREFFKEFICSYGRGVGVCIVYDLLPLQELEDDLDFDELHYSRIINEFERVLDLYAKEACNNLCTDVKIVEKDGFQRLYEYVDSNNSGNRDTNLDKLKKQFSNECIKYSESFVREF